MDNLVWSDNRVRFGEDVCATAAAVYDSKSIYFTDVPVYYYRRRADSLTTVSFNTAEMENAVILLAAIEKLLTEKGYWNAFVRYKEQAWHIVYLLRKIIDGKAPAKAKKENLALLKRHTLVRDFDRKAAKPYITPKQYYAITALKSKLYPLLLALGKKN